MSNFYVTERDVALEDRSLQVRLHEFRTEEGTTSASASSRPLLVLCVHGAGYSGMTFAPMAEALLGKLGSTDALGALDTTRVSIAAPDLRGHGATTAEDETDLSIETLVEDLESLYETHMSERYGDVVLIGWSLGAAVAIKAAARGKVGGTLGSKVVGLIAIDVVEGTAMEALKSMSMILAARPRGFNTVDDAIEWAISSGTARRRASAEVSVPGMLLERYGNARNAGGDDDRGREQRWQALDATSGSRLEKEKERNKSRMGPPPPIPRYPPGGGSPRGGSPRSMSLEPIGEEGGLGANNSGTVEQWNTDVEESTKKELNKKGFKYGWRVELERTEPFWKGWFVGLSQAFLDVSAPKLLLLAGHDRLDKTLTIAQMQGKFQMAVIPQAGHAVHEDQPTAVADRVAAFLTRYRLCCRDL